jgi:hypothetical protein
MTTSKYLTKEEIDKLPDDTVVEITWSGGNGPWKYRIKHLVCGVAAVDDRGGVVSIIDYVGDKKPRTTVRLA